MLTVPYVVGAFNQEGPKRGLLCDYKDFYDGSFAALLEMHHADTD